MSSKQRVFLTGASGYVGGQVLAELARILPELDVSILVRDSNVAKDIQTKFPGVHAVVGGLDDAELVAREASQASIVINAASNKHMPGAHAIHKGLKQSGTTSYWIQISGASLLAADELASPSYDVGRPSSTVYDDLDGISDIRALVEVHSSREMDNFILSVNKSTPSIKTAIVLPPIIYGKGQGPVNQRSIQIPSLAQVTLQKGHVVRAGEGLNRWGSIHVADVARVFTGLTQQAIEGNNDPSVWNENGIYLASSAEVSFGELSDLVSKAARQQGLISSDEVEVLSLAESDKILPKGSVFFGSNARGSARRATAKFGWKPIEQSVQSDIDRAVAEEASRR